MKKDVSSTRDSTGHSGAGSSRLSIKEKSYRTAMCGVAAALSVILLSVTGLIPIMTYAGPVTASAMLIPVIAETGRSGGWEVWAAVSLLTAFFSADKEAAGFYIFTGFYPMVRPYFERIGGRKTGRILRTAAKAAFFSVMLVLMYVVLLLVLMVPEVAESFAESGMALSAVLTAVLVVILLAYDGLIERFEIIYLKVLKPKLRIK